jgi:leucine dehydrogenase
MRFAAESGVFLEEVCLEGYEKVVVVTDDTVGLKAIICIHNTELGPALGGIRIYPYVTFEAALTDVSRLARSMTFKSAIAKVGLGGGKSVIVLDPKKKTPELLASFAHAVNQLNGMYICAEDVGCSVQDVDTLRQHTPYVVGTSHEKASGNPSPFTAFGTLRGMQAVVQMLDGSPSLKGKVVAVQGLGSVGAVLVDFLFWHGAKLIVSDIDWEKTQRIAQKYGARACFVKDILIQECDILAPCALGGVLNGQTIPQLRCRAVAGCANNQLLKEEDALALHERGILYAPDFVINAGGLINVSFDVEQGGYNPAESQIRVDAIFDQLIELFAIAKKRGICSNYAAVFLANTMIENGVGKRLSPPHFDHLVV